MLGRRVDVDHEFDVVYVNAAGGDVGSDKHAVRVALEERKIAVALCLREVSVQINGRNPSLVELLGKLLCLVLGAHEENATTSARGESLHYLTLRVGAPNVEHVVSHCLDVAVDLVD